MMILASLAGCIGTDDLVDDDTSTESLGTVIASTYHVEQLASAVGGDLVSVEMMSTMNVPVHDYEPSAQDIIRLNQADVFFYHGLGLEPWVEEPSRTWKVMVLWLLEPTPCPAVKPPSISSRC